MLTPTPGWPQFQEALARVLRATIATIDPREGLLTVCHPPVTPWKELKSHPALARAYREFFRGLSELDREKEEIRFITDPVDLPVAIVPLEGALLTIVGSPDKQSSGRRADFLSRLRAFGVRDTDRLWALAPDDDSEAFREKAAHVQRLYAHLMHATREGNTTQRPLLAQEAAAAVGVLLREFTQWEHFELHSALDLLICTLNLLFRAEGAWVFAYYGRIKTTTAHRGGREQFVAELDQAWKTAADRSRDPIVVVEARCRAVTDLAPELRLETTSVRHDDRGASLGIINPEDEGSRAVLSVFVEQVSNLLETAQIHDCTRYRLGTLFNAVRHGLLVANPDGRVVMANRRARNVFAVTGLALSVGRPLPDAGWNRSLKAALCSAAATGESHRQLLVSIERADTKHQLMWDIIPLRREDGSIVGLVLTLEDVTETMYFRRRMQEWEKMAAAGGIAAGLAHEIRNPLAAAAGAIQLLDLVNGEEKRQEVLSKLRAELDRMNKILTSFLQTTRCDTNENRQPLNLAHVIEDLHFLLRSEAHLHDVELIIRETPPGFPLVLGDADSLKQVFINLAKNAIEAVQGDGWLEISLHHDAEQAWVTFKDNGPGIPKDHLPLVFRPFFTTKLGGTGLGLWISTNVIRQMGGELRVESEPGRGTTVHVILPVKSVPAPETAGGDNAGRHPNL